MELGDINIFLRKNMNAQLECIALYVFSMHSAMHYTVEMPCIPICIFQYFCSLPAEAWYVQSSLVLLWGSVVYECYSLCHCRNGETWECCRCFVICCMVNRHVRSLTKIRFSSLFKITSSSYFPEFVLVPRRHCL